ncbi:flagellar hook-basal body complex protein [Mesobaculum littorinae]|uniref:Flagellar basal-body rod protein FlgF n=1 Tax=Mesobaculum littorinae TaxID=2486419 RepID=A0A438AGW9_9RHOB|nr:flagellar hook-basal body complex protein [Mesobaculum littorinae]RVV97960.1 flagellar hook-basal body complex protein [Mesobaculum littorinae]
MENITTAALTRQSGLMREMRAIANNVANISTTGYRKEGVIFSEYVKSLGEDAPSLSLGTANVRMTSELPGTVTQTGADFDFAIQGEGYFLIETPEGEALTRAGSFTPNEGGELVTPQGFRLLDAGGAPVFIPPDAGAVTLAADGTLSADDRPVAQIGLWSAPDPATVTRRDGVMMTLGEPPEPVEGSRILQGHLEGSNVNPVSEIARMIEVQRAYELGQNFLQREDERVRGVMRTLSQQ